MTRGFLARFVAEIAFLALLALAAGLAELTTPWIAAVMAAGWVLVALVEWLAWRTETEAEGESARTDIAAVDQSTDSWDLNEILAPVPEAEDGTRVIPSQAGADEGDGE
jgi:hypothetical protein